jgi:electron transfer flavoprotein alpha subunit
MAHKVLTFIEQRDGEIKKSSLEALTLGRRLAADAGGTAAAVVAGSGVAGLADTLAAYGAAEVYLADHDALALYSAEGYTAAAAKAIEASAADVLLLPATAMGKDLGPRAAARLDYAFIADVVEADIEGGKLVAVRPQYAGKVLCKVACAAEKVVLTSRPNVFAAEQAPGSPSLTPLDLGEIAPKGRVAAFVKSEKDVIDVAEADVIVAGGRGLKGPENFPLLFDLAKSLGAAVGASRAVVDAGWISHDHQVGQTGKTVAPGLYVAAGISGAIQHLAGMRTSKRIVVINKDADAPIFKVADYGIVGDALEILPKLTEAVNAAKS